MGFIEIIYGLKITSLMFENLYPHQDYLNFYDEDGEDDGEPMSFINLDKVCKHLDVGMKGIKIRHVDFDYSVGYKDKNVVDDDSDRALIIGVVLGKCRLHYSGVLKVPNLDEDSHNIMKQYVNEHPIFAGLSLGLYSYSDEQR